MKQHSTSFSTDSKDQNGKTATRDRWNGKNFQVFPSNQTEVISITPTTVSAPPLSSSINSSVSVISPPPMIQPPTVSSLEQPQLNASIQGTTPKYIYLKYRQPDDKTNDAFHKSDGCILPFVNIDDIKIVYVEGPPGVGERGPPGIGIQGEPGKPGEPGKDGQPGKDGKDAKGVKGDPGDKGETGGQGLQGTAGADGEDGKPCVCLNMTKKETSTIRIIRNKGSHNIELSDTRIVIDTNDSITLFLPDLPSKYKPEKGNDFRFKSKIFKIVCYAGTHTLKPLNGNSKINGFMSSYVMSTNQATKSSHKCEAILMDTGNWVIV